VADVKISQLPAAISLQASDIGPFVSGGVTTQATTQQIVDAGLPSQTGQATKVLGTDGTTLSWVSGGAGSINIVPDSITATPVYPAFVEATSGAVTLLNIDNSHLSYVPATGVLTAVGMTATNGLFYNADVVSKSVTVPAGYNAFSAGPMTVPGGVVVTTTGSSTWKVV
jgi:hypothetical protein